MLVLPIHQRTMYILLNEPSQFNRSCCTHWSMFWLFPTCWQIVADNMIAFQYLGVTLLYIQDSIIVQCPPAGIDDCT